MDAIQQNHCGKGKRRNYLTNKELQDDYFSKTRLRVFNFVNQSKDNCKNIDGLRNLRTSTKIGWFFQILFKMKNIISRAFSLFITLKQL